MEEIRKKYIEKASEIIKLNKKKYDLISNPLEKLSEKVKEQDTFSRKLVDILNEVLEENNISFKSEIEKSNFLEYIKPTTIELLQKNMI